MSPLTTIWRRVRMLVNRNRLDDELREELTQHLDARTQALIDEGMDPREAAYEARRVFGNVTAIREETRTMWGFPSIETLAQDLRYAARLLRRSPMFAVMAIVALGIGIGAATAVFGLVDAFVLQKLPVSRPDELAILRWRGTGRMPAPSLSGNWDQTSAGIVSTSFSLPTFEALRRDGRASNVRVVGFAGHLSLNISVDGQPEPADAHAVSGNYFDVLGLTPAAGRLFVDADDRPGSPAVAVISHELWTRRFGRAADAVGRLITVNATPVTIVGVLPPGFRGTMQVTEAPALMVPLALRETLQRDPEYRTAERWWVLLMARLPADASREAVRSALDTSLRRSVADGNAALTPADLPALELLPGARGQFEARDGMREPLKILAIIVSIVLLVACAIVANLLLARGQVRRREVVVRVAIGAPRGRIVRQLLTEGFLLAALGSAFGLLVARWMSGVLMPTLGGASAGLTVGAGPSWRLLAFTGAIAMLSTVIVALVPALRSTDVDLATGLHGQQRGIKTGLDRRSLSRGLVIVQVALSVLLLASAGLLVRSIGNLRAVETGFDPSHLLTFRLDPSRNGYDRARVGLLYTTALSRLAALPGVTSTTLLSNSLIGAGGSSTVAALPSAPPLEPGSPEARAFFDTHGTFVLTVSEDFFRTMGIPVLRGRGLVAADTAQASPVAVVNQRLAQQLFGHTDVIGQRFKTSLQTGAPIYEIVGVSADAKYTSLRRDAPPTAYFTYRQRGIDAATIAIKTPGDPLDLATAAREAIRQVDPDVPVLSLRTQEAQIEQSLRRESVLARLATILGGITLLLCGIGLYGLLAYTVTQRASEIGLRMALGATGRSVRWIVMRQALTLVAAGLAVGLPTALTGARVLDSTLFGLTAADPVSLAGAAMVMVLVGAAAAYTPARRAARVDPIVALRAE